MVLLDKENVAVVSIEVISRWNYPVKKPKIFANICKVTFTFSMSTILVKLTHDSNVNVFCSYITDSL